MIVKNEEDWVAGAVDSVRSIVDEVIILDTGSADSTVARARALGARVLTSAWTASFAEARNQSLEAATQSWILVLDADERVAPRDLLQIRRAADGSRADGYHLIQRNYVSNNRILGWTPNPSHYEEGANYAGYVDNPLIRLFRNSPEIRFHGAVHEIIDPTRLPRRFAFDSIPAVIHHYGKVRSEEHLRAKQELYLALGLKKIEEDPGNPKAYFDLGIQYQELGRHAEARGCFQKAFEMGHPPATLLYWALSEKHLGEYESAAGLLRRALKLGLDTPEVHLELGNAYLAQDEWGAAQEEYAICLSLDANNSMAAFNCGLALRKAGDMDGAVRFYERALRLDSKFREAAMELAVLYVRAGRPDEALRALEAVSERDAPVLSLIGAAHLQKNNLDAAQKHLEAALRKDRSLADARLNLAQVYLRKGDPVRAARYVQSVNAV